MMALGPNSGGVTWGSALRKALLSCHLEIMIFNILNIFLLKQNLLNKSDHLNIYDKQKINSTYKRTHECSTPLPEIKQSSFPNLGKYQGSAHSEYNRRWEDHLRCCGNPPSGKSDHFKMNSWVALSTCVIQLHYLALSGILFCFV